uniref:hypothetical protein n=1 Tax=Ensifer adhaerens TaxID=106592 RepID=UPI003F49729A
MQSTASFVPEFGSVNTSSVDPKYSSSELPTMGASRAARKVEIPKMIAETAATDRYPSIRLRCESIRFKNAHITAHSGVELISGSIPQSEFSTGEFYDLLIFGLGCSCLNGKSGYKRSAGSA